MDSAIASTLGNRVAHAGVLEGLMECEVSFQIEPACAILDTSARVSALAYARE
jgi:hypothetical protein